MKPRIAAGVLADLLAAAPGRVRKRLDADPGAAARWPWHRDGDTWTVTAGTETVQLTPSGLVVADSSQARCSCLLSPRCVHLLAVLSTLEVEDAPLEPPDPPEGAAEGTEGTAEGAAHGASPGTARGVAQRAAQRAAPDGPAGGTAGDEPGAGGLVELDARQAAAVALAWRAGARLLAVGAAGGTLLRVDLLRAAHACQHAGLYRLGAVAVRVATGVHNLAAGLPEFELGGLADDLAELLAVAWRLGGGPREDGDGARRPATMADVGVARRRYEPVGSLRLHGLFSEAVIAGSGHAGVVTHMLDGDGRLWTVPDVAPGPPERAASAYGSAVRFGQLALKHRELGRSEVLAQGASASADGRLGSGGGVTATRAGPSAWAAPPAAGRWSVPLEDQLDRAWAALDAAGDGGRHLRGGDDLVFLDSVVHGPVHGGVGLMVRNARPPAVVTGLAASDHDTLQYLPNLRRLAAMAGTELLIIGRVRVDRPRSVTLLAAGGPGLSLPASWRGRANLGLDQLAGGHTGAGATTGATTGVAAGGEGAAAVPPAPLDGLRRVALRAVLGGRATLAAPAWSGVATEVARLRRGHLATAADLLERLAAAGVETRRSFTGERYAPPPDHLARVWIATMTYLRAADRSLARALPGPPP